MKNKYHGNYYCKCLACNVRWVVFSKPIRCIYCGSANFEFHHYDERKLKKVLSESDIK